MPTKTDNDLNPSQRDYEGTFNGTHDRLPMSDEVRDHETNKLEDAYNAPSANDINNQEQRGATQSNQSDENLIINNYTGKNAGGTGLRGRLKRLWSKKSIRRSAPFLALGGGLAGIIGAISFMIPGGFMVSSLMQMMTSYNDSTSTVMERRFIKSFAYASGANNDADPNCQSKKIKCRGMGRISNSALRKLEAKGVRACFGGNCDGPVTRRTGWPAENPSGYKFTLDDGTTRTVPVNQLNSFLTDRGNYKYTSKIYGPGGAINFRTRAYAGSIMKKVFWNPFGLSRDGGNSAGDDKDGKSRSALLRQAYERYTNKIPGVEEARTRVPDLRTKMSGEVDRLKKGGTAYLAAASGCVALKVPRYVAAGVAAIQVVQVMNSFQESVGSPGARIQAAGIDEASAIDPVDNEVAASILTDRQPHSETGELGSAVESKYLLAAAGLGGTLSPSEKFSPGYGLLQSPDIREAAIKEELTIDKCNVILHPATMYAAAGADGVLTIIGSATIVGGIIKVVGGFAVGVIVERLITGAVSEYYDDALLAIAENDAIPEARGVELGDTIGIGAAAFFSTASMARGIPPLTESKLAEYDAIRRENEQVYAELARESLSPFDISSRYTALGSVVHNTGVILLRDGFFSADPLTRLAIFTNSAFASLTPKAMAADYGADYCSVNGYDIYGGPSDDPVTRTFAGTPCTGFTATQSGMSTSLALDLMIEEGWVDPEVDVEDGSSPQELVDSGVIVEDTPLADYIAECMNPVNGSFIYNAENCAPISLSGNSTGRLTGCDSEDSAYGCPPAEEDSDLENAGIKDARSVEAMSVFLIDYQINQMHNGTDNEYAEAPA